MAAGYAVIGADGRETARSAAFDEADVTQRVPLADGSTLLVSGGSETEALRRELAQARQTNDARQTFMSRMSHDIRTPMNAIVGLTALARTHIDERPRVADALMKIETASTQLLSLINEVLDMSYLDSGRFRVASAPFALSDLLHAVMTVIRPLAEKKQQTLRLSAGAVEAENFRGDADRLRQVFVNIANNAVKYTSEGGRIGLSVSVTKTGQTALLRFVCRDNGMGMSEAFLARLFEPFERAENGAVSRTEGTGLGMSIVKKLTEAMGGSIAVKSREWMGTEVTVEVPLECVEQEPVPAALTGRKLLIIEADEDRRAAYERILGEAGAMLTVVPGASEAVEALTEAAFTGTPFSLCVIGGSRTDDGTLYDAAEYLHQASPGMVLVLVSDDDWDKIEYRAGRAGIRYFLPLPFFAGSLTAGLSRALTGEESGGTVTEAPDLTGMHLLLAEDNPINREIALEFLKSTHAAVDAAEDGRAAVNTYLQSAPGTYGCILMDVQMPVMDGYEATRAIRESGRPDADVPIYAMTANTFAEDIARAREAGMNGHIAKPVDIAVLMQTLRRLR